jgi:hypothetical protein
MLGIMMELKLNKWMSGMHTFIHPSFWLEHHEILTELPIGSWFIGILQNVEITLN